VQSPAVANGVVYAAGTYGSSNLWAFDASAGALLWSANLGPVSCSPTVANGMVYVGDDSGHVSAFGLP
jgi:outer membrane protein assembly factor BamB